MVLLGVGWRRVLLSFRGSAAVGTVTGIGGAGPPSGRAQISFRTASGKDVGVRLNVPKRTRAGDQLEIRYDPARPEFATNRSASAVVARFLLPVVTLAAVGLAGVAGTLYTAGAGGFDAFSDGYAVVVLAVFGLYAFFVSYLRHGSSVAGAAAAPMLVGAVLLTGAVVLAWK